MFIYLGNLVHPTVKLRILPRGVGPSNGKTCLYTSGHRSLQREKSLFAIAIGHGCFGLALRPTHGIGMSLCKRRHDHPKSTNARLADRQINVSMPPPNTKHGGRSLNKRRLDAPNIKSGIGLPLTQHQQGHPDKLQLLKACGRITGGPIRGPPLGN